MCEICIWNCAEGDILSKTTESKNYQEITGLRGIPSFGLTLLTSPFDNLYIGLSAEVSMGDCVAVDIGKQITN